MKELKNIGTVLAVAVIVALIFVVIWAYNNNNDHLMRITQMEQRFQMLESHLGKSEHEKNDMKTSILEITETLRCINHRVKRNDVKNIYDSLEVIELKLKSDDNNFNLPTSRSRHSRRKPKKHPRRYESSDDSSSGSESDDDYKTELEKRRKRRSSKL